ncbi:MAG TPA: glycoside hydrolase family 18 protein [Kofleriaceae bacterium]|nr:glycoside hydrolase family 18 protein [Kofleriaceae bacterium]
MRMIPLLFALCSCVTMVGESPELPPGMEPGSDPGGDLGTGTGAGTGTGTPSARRTVGYFAAWDVYDRAYNISDMPSDLLTVINYAFLNISPTGECILGDAYADVEKVYPGDSTDPTAVRGNFHQLQLLKQARPQLKVLLSVGGWTWSERFSDVALTDASRARFAQSCVALVAKYGFDGLDIDWEYPGGGGLTPGRPEDTQNYTKLLAALRAALGTKLLTIAAPAAPAQIAKIEVAKVAQIVDWVNVMTYDFHGSFELRTNFSAPLAADPADGAPGAAALTVTAALRAWLSAGTPPIKLVAGMPLYGYGWSGVPAANNGLYQTATAIPMGTWAPGHFDYRDIVANYLPAMQRRVSPAAKSPWLYDPARALVITYDDAASLTAKTSLVRDLGLGGAMFWELSGDDAQHTLVRAVHAELHR